MSLVHVTVIERNYGNAVVKTTANARHPAVVAAVADRGFCISIGASRTGSNGEHDS